MRVIGNYVLYFANTFSIAANLYVVVFSFFNNFVPAEDWSQCLKKVLAVIVLSWQIYGSLRGQ